MEFKKISDSKFQCLLFEEDLEENNITLDDFFKNDSAKIHSLLDVVMEQAHDSIGMELKGGVVSLQLTPQPNRSLLLTVSCGQDDIGDMLKAAGQRAAQLVSELGAGKMLSSKEELEQHLTELPSEKSLAKMPQADKAHMTEDIGNGMLAVDGAGNIITNDGVICAFDTLEDVESFCAQSSRTWGIKNSLYKDNELEAYYLVMERTRCSKVRFEMYVNSIMECAELIIYDCYKVAYIKEHFEVIIPDNAVNTIKKYCD